MNLTEKASMMLSWSVISTTICCAILLLYTIVYRRGKRIHIEDIYLMLILIVLSGLRYDVGSDYIRYLGSYKFASYRFSDLSFLYSIEILRRYSFEVGYETLSVFVSRFTSYQYAIFWVVAVIIYIPVIFYCRKHTSNARAAVATFLLFGFWGLTLNVLKQAIAMVLMLYAFEALERKRYIITAVLTIIATSFHITSLGVIALMIIVHSGILRKVLEPNYTNLSLMIIIGLVLRFGTDILIRIVSRIGLYSKYLSFLSAGTDSNISRKYIMYGAFIETIIVILILYFIIKKWPFLKNHNPQLEKITSLVMIGIPFSIIGISRTLWLSNRYAKFFFLFLIVLVPELFWSEVKPKAKIGHIAFKQSQLLFWIGMVIWHAVYAVLMLDNNGFHINTYLFQQ